MSRLWIVILTGLVAGLAMTATTALAEEPSLTEDESAPPGGYHGQQVQSDRDVPAAKPAEPATPAEPSAQPAKERRSTRAGSSGVYVVKKGDTLAKIAHAELGDASEWKRIAELNDIRNPARLEVGTRLQLPYRQGLERPMGEPAPAAQRRDSSHGKTGGGMQGSADRGMNSERSPSAP